MASVSSNVFVHGYKKFLEQSLVFCDSDEGDIQTVHRSLIMEDAI